MGETNIMNEINVLELKGVSYADPETKKHILKNVNLQVKQGEVVAIYGYNGCGKSTLLNVIANQINGVYSGDIFINGEKIEKGVSFDFTKIAYAEQSNKKADANRVREELSNMDERVDVKEIAEYFKGEKLLDKRMATLSGGQKQIVYIMKAFLRKESDLILLDEPINNLDRVRAILLSNFLKEFIKKNPTKAVIIVTHCRMFPKVTAYNMENGELRRLKDDEPCGSCFGIPDEEGYYTIPQDYTPNDDAPKQGFFKKILSFFKF